MAALPTELYELIIFHLPRQELKILRLVCREFEHQVSVEYFKNVVVPFNTELYSKLKRNNPEEELQNLSPPLRSIFSNGMHLFQSFGHHMLRFALSLELDENALAYPPIKPVQEAVPAFWGIYRWPHDNYHRYADLAGLEKTADETEGMKEAFMCLSKVANLGLSCDAGLGFLLGPGHNARRNRRRDPVFATQDWRVDQRHWGGLPEPPITVADFNNVTGERRQSISDPLGHKRRLLDQMVGDAGFAGSDAVEAVQAMLDTEDVTMSSIDLDERCSVVELEQGRLSQLSASTNFLTLDDTENHEPSSSSKTLADLSHWVLIPTSLTRAQKELLLELEWAHRAMIQSFVIALIDNSRADLFSHLTCLTLAKIPSCHVNSFLRHDLWESMRNLDTVALGIIADWRRVSKTSPGIIEDTAVSPVKAVSKAFELLNDYIGTRPNIESLYFEWICGGEFAPSPYQRNMHILPAPLTADPQYMISPTSAYEKTNLLHLPHIKHLSLKNCWSSPHVLLQTLRQLALCSLEKLELESVSLSGSPTRAPQNALHVGAFANGTALPTHAEAQLAAATATLEPDVPITEAATRLQWSGILDHFSTSVKLRDLDAADELTPSSEDSLSMNEMATAESQEQEAFVPDVEKLNLETRKYKLKTLSFKSCGYVMINDPHINTRLLLPRNRADPRSWRNRSDFPLSSFMQHCSDKFLGRILPWLQQREIFVLGCGFGMELDWERVYNQVVIDEATLDGVENPGQGRFSGILKRTTSDPWKDYESFNSSDSTLASSHESYQEAKMGL